jgi:hypothetical protein
VLDDDRRHGCAYCHRRLDRDFCPRNPDIPDKLWAELASRWGNVFSTPITRPFRWALPLAIVGLVVSTLITLAPAKAGGLECGIFRSGGGWFGYAPQTTERFDPFADCQRMLRRRAAAARLVNLVAFAPAVVLTIRGFLWGANTLYMLAERDSATPPSAPQ